VNGPESSSDLRIGGWFSKRFFNPAKGPQAAVVQVKVSDGQAAPGKGVGWAPELLKTA
jgi:hypothetical protein